METETRAARADRLFNEAYSNYIYNSCWDNLRELAECSKGVLEFRLNDNAASYWLSVYNKRNQKLRSISS